MICIFYGPISLKWEPIGLIIPLPPWKHHKVTIAFQVLCWHLPTNYEIRGSDGVDGERCAHCWNEFFISTDPQISLGWDWWERDSCGRGGKIGVKSLRAEQVSVICSLGAWCQPYNSDLDSPHKRENSFELHMWHGALQVNPGSAVTSRLEPGEGDPLRPSPATRLSGWRFIRAVDWWISFE